MFPKLRFKEFDGDLTESKLVELTLWASGGTPAKDIPEYWGDDIPLISGASMHTNQLYESDVKITRLGLQKGSKLAPKDSILILVRGSMLFNKIPMGITLGDVAFNQDVKCIRPKQQLAPLFLFQWLHAKENTIQNKVTATGIGAGKLDTADLQNLKLYKPSLEEQTKIATFLSAVDEKISQLTQKHQLLREYKQGMMQKLFSQQVRFKADDGSEFGEWDQLKFKDVIKIKYGKDHKKLDDGDIPVLGTGGVMRYVDSYLYEGESILIGRKGTIDKPRFISGKFWTVDTLFYTEIGEKILPKFAFQQLLLVNWLNLNEATGVPSLNTTSIGNIELKVPCLAEQTKIANVLSAIDQKIEVVSKQIEQAKQWKKGLLQQMFI